MNVEWQQGNEGAPVLSFSGALNFNLECRLLDLLDAGHLPPSPTTIVADFEQVDSMDSGALGMLLVLRERIGRQGHRVQLRNCSPAALEKLRIAHFHTLFQIAA